jgi:hypothetical protein
LRFSHSLMLLNKWPVCTLLHIRTHLNLPMQRWYRCSLHKLQQFCLSTNSN